MKDNKNKDQYIVLFSGAKLSKLEANRVGVGLIIGIIGAIFCAFVLGAKYKVISFFIILVLSAIGYFWVGKKIFKA